jgi:hypothetical protein
LKEFEVQNHLPLRLYLLFQSKFLCVKISVDLVDMGHVVIFLLSRQEKPIHQNRAQNNQHKNGQISTIVVSKRKHVQVVRVAVAFPE